MRIDQLLTQAPAWQSALGPHEDVVVSSRIRLARNVDGYFFPSRLKGQERKRLIKSFEKAVSQPERFPNSSFFSAADLNAVELQLLLERHLISREFSSDKGDRAVLISSDESQSLMFMEEDHLRIQIFESGLNLRSAWKKANETDDQLQKDFRFSFNPKIGFLTACPTNVGTGLRASCMLHLPSLVITKQIQKVLQALTKLNLAVRGMFGEGSQALGNFFQFSNQMTLGQPEEEVIDNLLSVIEQVVSHEHDAAEQLQRSKPYEMEDQVWRAVGLLKSARVMSSTEAISLLSMLRFGVNLKYFGKTLTHPRLNQLFLLIQPGHLQKTRGCELSSPERDSFRAELIRKQLLKLPI
ncbi:MAG TPA: protein arginine kinase [Candidatus Omnitrophica bacterium]|nr:protein arginine kinase [Candidatus Omnitrophota bacterium]